MSMEGLRRGAQNINSGSGKGQTRSSFYAKIKLPQMAEDLKRYLAAPPSPEAVIEVAEPMVLIAGQYPDLYARDANNNPLVPPPVGEGLHYRAHTFPVTIQPKTAGQQGFRTFRDIVCSAGPEPHAPQPCVGCNLVDHGADAKARDRWVFNVAHLGWYHEHPLVKDNQVQMKKDGSGPVMVKEECRSYKMLSVLYNRAVQAGNRQYKPQECEGCKNQWPFVWGEHRLIEVGWKHLNNILDFDTALGKKCANCGTYLLRMSFNCGNESCNAVLVNIGQSGWTQDQCENFAKTAQHCPQCNYQGLPRSNYQCGFDEKYIPTQQPCQDTRKTSIFDCVIWAQREGEKTESEIVIKKVELINNYTTPDGKPSPDGRPLAEHLKSIVKSPFNLVEMYKPESLDDQAKAIRVQNPYAQQQWGQYGSQQTQPQQQPQGYPQQGWGQQPTGQAPVAQYPNMPQPGRPNYGK